MKAFKQCKGRVIEIRKQNSSDQFKLIFKKYIYQILPVTCVTLAVRFSSKTIQVYDVLQVNIKEIHVFKGKGGKHKV